MYEFNDYKLSKLKVVCLVFVMFNLTSIGL